MAKLWKCEVCGYIHKGDAPPDQCPVCGVGKELFSVFEVAPNAAGGPAPRAWRCTICDFVEHGEEAPSVCPVCGAERSLFEPHRERTPPRVAADVQRVVILGAGIAGVTAAEQARAASPYVAVTLIGRERRLPYYRLNLTRFLAGELGEEALPLHPPTWYAEQKIDRFEAEVTAIDRKRQEVVVDDGRRLPYDRLVLANGAHAFVPPILGATRERVFTVRGVEDCLAVLAAATERGASQPRCVCIGGGLLGLETAGALGRRGLSITVVEGFGWLLPRQLAEPAARQLEAHLAALGMSIRTSAKVEEIVGDEAAQGVRLAGGEVLPAELVVIAAGVRPNSYLARQTGLEVKNGVIVDDRMFTSDPAILAAGDVAEHRGVVYGLWPTAYAQGLVAGENAVGGSLEYHGAPPSNRLKVLDVDLFSIGQFTAVDGSYSVLERSEGATYRRLVCRDGVLVGANLYGDTGLAQLCKEGVESAAQLATQRELVERAPELARYIEERGTSRA
jgi:nitrite reductase (NADH) large subunit